MQSYAELLDVVFSARHSLDLFQALLVDGHGLGNGIPLAAHSIGEPEVDSAMWVWNSSVKWLSQITRSG